MPTDLRPMPATRPTPVPAAADNDAVAAALREMAQRLRARHDNPYRALAYEHAADTIAGLPDDVAGIFQRGGEAGLDALPAIGSGIAAAIAELLTTGRWRQLEAERALRLPAPAEPPVADPDTAEPPVGLLLDVDRVYREQARAGRLPTIAPRRFNPGGEAWLPVLHTRRGAWSCTALFSNTARAHALDPGHDWVVIYVQGAPLGELRYTVITARRGPLAGRRTVAGREAACRDWYATLPPAPAG